MDTTPLEDAEALRNLWEDVERLARDSRRLADATARLTHTVRRFVQTYVAGTPDDPRHLLGELGAVLELLGAVDLLRSGLEDAIGSLGFALVPKAEPHAALQERALTALRERIGARGLESG